MRQRTDVDLSYIDPRTEALSCFKVAHANGGIKAMRRLISISPEQEKILHRLEEAGEISQLIVWRALAYREQVLDEFDRLVTKSRARKKILGQRSETKDNRGQGATDMKYVSEFDPIPCDEVASEQPLSKHRHHFNEGSRVTVIDGPHAGRSGKLEAINAHDGHVVKLDDGNMVEYHHKELEPEGFGTYSRAVSTEKLSAIGHAMSRGATIMKADASSDDPLPIGEPLAKSRAKIDPKNVVVGMKVRNHDGTIGTITKVRGASVNISYPNGEGVSLITHVEAA